MRPKALFSAPDLARLPIVVDKRAVSLAEGLRAGLSVAVIIALGEYLTLPLLREAALAALLTCICDPGGPIRRRVPVLLSFTLIGAGVTASYGLLRDLGPAVALPLGVLGLFCCSFARIYGPAPQQLGALLSVVQILSLDQGDPSLTRAALVGAAFIAGSLWAILLTLVIWRIHPFLPARRAVAQTYRALSELVGDLDLLTHGPARTDAAWEAHARKHRRATREAIEAARKAIMDIAQSRGAAGNRAAQIMIRLETADQIFGGCIALSDLLEHGSASERKVAEHILQRMRPVLLTLGQVIVSDDAEAHRDIDGALAAIAGEAAGLPDKTPLRAVISQILERLRIAHTLAGPATLGPGADQAGRPPPLWQRIIRPLRANLTWKSPALRHALRTGVTAALPLAFTMAWFTPYDHWLTITVVATMQPYYSLTYTRAIERVVGTAIGGMVAACVGLMCTTPFSETVAMFALSVAAFAVRAVSFGLFMLALTPFVVLLVETGSPGTNEWMIAFARATLTTIGGVIAIGANFLLWPSREPDLLAAEVRQAINTHSAYANADFSALLEEADGASLNQARRDAGVASNNLEALITRALLEPGNKHQDQLEAAMVVDAALRRFAGRLATLQHDQATALRLAPPTLRAWREWVTGSLRALASGSTTLLPRPAGAEADALVRIARQIELMAGAMQRLP